MKELHAILVGFMTIIAGSNEISIDSIDFSWSFNSISVDF